LEKLEKKLATEERPDKLKRGKLEECVGAGKKK